MVSGPVPFSRGLLYGLTPPPPGSGDAGVWVVMDFCWTFECDEQSSITREVLHVECARFQGRALLSQEICNDFLPACQK